MKKQYMKPAATIVKVGLAPLLAGSNSLWVDPSKEGDPTKAESRRYRNSLWDDDDE